MAPRLFAAILLIFAACTAAGNAAWALSVESVRFGAHENTTRMVLDLSESADFRVFVLPSPYRMVVDLPDFEWRAGSIGKPKGAGVTDIRQGRLQPGVSRVVVDLDRPVAVRSAFLLPRGEGRPDRLVVDFAAISSGDFERERSKIHGTLALGDGLNAAHSFPAPAAPTAAAAMPGRKPEPPPAASGNARRPLVVIDPGHGGVDPGAPGANGVFEKHVTLAMGKELKRQLEATGRYRVLLTRDRDVYLRLPDRVAFARKHDADLFVSLHADSIDKPGVRGASIYSLSEKASDAQTARLADRENRADLIAGVDLTAEDKQVVSILVDLAMRETMNQSKFFANAVVETLASRSIQLLESPHRSAGFAVLKAPDIPSILIETGFMSNKKDAGLLTQPEYREKMAGALVKGIDAYFERLNRHRRS